MSMTKKHFVMIAQAINSTRYDNNNLDGLAYHLAAEFERENPRFDRKRFLEACGVNG